MKLIVQQSGKYQYVSIRESYWDSVRKKYSSRTVKNYGRLDYLQKDDPDILEKLEAQVEVAKMAQMDDQQKQLRERVASSSVQAANSADAYANNRVVMLGGCVYRRIWNKLGMQRKCRDLIKGTNIAFNFPDAVFYMVAARALMPDSKLAQWKARNQFLYRAEGLDLHHLYRSVTLLHQNKQSIVTYLNRQIAKNYNRTVTAVLYDVTTFAFESQEKDELRNFGFSKDCKVNQTQVVMGLLIDDQGVPIDYELYSGNTSEFSTMVPILKKLKKEYGIGRVIVAADRGLNSGKNLLDIKDLGMDYVIAYRLKGSGTDIRKTIEDPEGWHSYAAPASTRTDVSRYKITTETRSVKTVDADGRTCYKEVVSKLLINYSARRARKDAADRQRLIDKAQRYAENPSLLKSDMRRGGKSYLKISSDSMQAEVDVDRIRKAEFFDGYYGIVYSDENMTPDQVLSVHHSLWQIEESFRISKSLLEARPCFHWKDPRIRGHFVICYLALVIHRLLERELADHGIHLSAEQIVDSLSAAQLTEAKLNDGQAVYLRANIDESFEKIADTLGLGRLPRIANAAQIKHALKLKEL